MLRDFALSAIDWRSSTPPAMLPWFSSSRKSCRGTPIELAGTQWQLLTEGDWEEDGPAVTLAFLDDYRAAGIAPCLDYLATYEASEGRIGFPTDVDGWSLLPVLRRRDSQVGRRLHKRPFASSRLLCRQGCGVKSVDDPDIQRQDADLRASVAGRPQHRRCRLGPERHS